MSDPPDSCYNNSNIDWREDKKTRALEFCPAALERLIAILAAKKDLTHL